MGAISREELRFMKRAEFGVLGVQVAMKIVEKVHKMEFLGDPKLKEKTEKIMFNRRNGRIGRHVSECKECKAAFREVRRVLAVHTHA